MSQVEVPAPHGWGKDLLTSWFDDFRGNQHATFSNKPKVVADLIGIDTLFDRFLNGAIDPEPFYPIDFFLRAHSAYRSATSAVMAGQIYEAQVLLRLCLDLGAYGIYVGADKRRWVRWLARSDSSDAKKVVRAEFTHNKIKIHIKNSAPKNGDRFETLYDTLIDFGAHPNELGFSLSSSITKEIDRVHFDTIYLHGDGVALNYGLKTTAQVGLWVLHVAQLVYPDRFQILGIRDQLEEIRNRY